MPIDKDGTITAPSEGQRYITRVLVEAEYDAASPEQAQLSHAMILGYLTMMTDDMPSADFQLTYSQLPQDAKNPAALPEGEGEDGVQPGDEHDHLGHDTDGCGECVEIADRAIDGAG